MGGDSAKTKDAAAKAVVQRKAAALLASVGAPKSKAKRGAGTHGTGVRSRAGQRLVAAGLITEVLGVPPKAKAEPSVDTHGVDAELNLVVGNVTHKTGAFDIKDVVHVDRAQFPKLPKQASNLIMPTCGSTGRIMHAKNPEEVKTDWVNRNTDVVDDEALAQGIALSRVDAIQRGVALGGEDMSEDPTAASSTSANPTASSSNMPIPVPKSVVPETKPKLTKPQRTA